ncbi:MAG: hypothetical protein ACTHLO_08470 [Pseudolabrys sp.]
MTDIYRTETAAAMLAEPEPHAISWRAIVAGGFAAAALTLTLIAFGAAVGFSSVSPWSNSGVSAGTFKVASGIYLVVVALLSSTVGGYIAGRLRTRWTGLKTYEVQFRDTAHGFLAWAFATVMGAAILGTSATYLAGGIAQATTGRNDPASSPTAYYVDMMFRPAANARAPGGAGAAAEGFAANREAQAVFTHDMATKGDWPSADRTFLAQLVSARTGLAGADAEKRVNDTIGIAKADADRARKAAASLSIWLTISMFVGAFAASLAAIEGGQLRDGRWKGVIGTRAYREQQAL